MTEKRFDLFRLFSTPVFVGKLGLNTKEILKVKTDIEKEKYILNANKSAERSEDVHILDKKKFKFLKDKINELFDIYKNDVFKYQNTNMIMTTSWIAKVQSARVGDYHNHTNSMFSGVYYINTTKNSGSITFNSFPVHRQIQPSINDPIEYTIDNSPQYTFYPENDMILLFPSHTYHKIQVNESDETRYSIAFNYMPYGETGGEDSILNLTVKDITTGYEWDEKKGKFLPKK